MTDWDLYDKYYKPFELNETTEKQIYDFLVFHKNKNTWNSQELYRWNSSLNTNDETIWKIARKYKLV